MNVILFHLTYQLNRITNTSSDIEEEEIRKRIHEFENSVHGRYIKHRSMPRRSMAKTKTKTETETERNSKGWTIWAHDDSEREYEDKKKVESSYYTPHLRINDHINIEDMINKRTSDSISDDSFGTLTNMSSEKSTISSQTSSKALFCTIPSKVSLESNKSSSCSPNNDCYINQK